MDSHGQVPRRPVELPAHLSPIPTTRQRRRGAAALTTFEVPTGLQPLDP